MQKAKQQYYETIFFFTASALGNNVNLFILTHKFGRPSEKHHYKIQSFSSHQILFFLNSFPQWYAHEVQLRTKRLPPRFTTTFSLTFLCSGRVDSLPSLGLFKHTNVFRPRRNPGAYGVILMLTQKKNRGCCETSG